MKHPSIGYYLSGFLRFCCAGVSFPFHPASNLLRKIPTSDANFQSANDKRSKFGATTPFSSARCRKG